MSGMENTKTVLSGLAFAAALGGLSIASMKTAIWICGGPTLAALVLGFVPFPVALVVAAIVTDLRSK